MNLVKNPMQLKNGDFILIKHVEKNSEIPKNADNKWFEIKALSFTGIPAVYLNQTLRFVRPDNVQLIKRAN